MEPEPPETIEQKAQRLRIDVDLPEKMGFVVTPFSTLSLKQREEVTGFYSQGWDHVLRAEYKAGIWKREKKGMPMEKAIFAEVWKQLHTSGRRFPQGQAVLLKDIDGEMRPIILTRSQIWHVPDVEDQVYYENYPKTWYLASGNGNGHFWIPCLAGGKPDKFKNYKKVLDDNPDVNEELDLVLINYALTRNLDENCQVKGASLAAVTERARFALTHGIKHCDTMSPLNNYADWASKQIKKNLPYEYTPEDFIRENVLEPILRTKKTEKKKPGLSEIFEAFLTRKEPRLFTAIGMHMHFGATSMQYFPNARIDPDSMNYCGVCRYF